MMMISALVFVVGFIAFSEADCRCGVTPGKWEVDNTPVRQFPWQAYIETAEGNKCSGFLINDRWVVSAASCVSPDDKTKASDLKVYIGQPCSHNATDSRLHLVDNIVKRSGFMKKTDIVLLDLTTVHDGKSMQVNQDTNPPVCSGTGTELPKTGYIATGYAENQCLKPVNVKLVDLSECKKLYSWFTPSDSVLCGVVDKPICGSDFGSPLLVWQKGQVFSLGMAAYMPKDGCSKNIVVFENIDYHWSWIRKTTLPLTFGKKGDNAHWCY